MSKLENLKKLIPKVYVCPKCQGKIDVISKTRLSCAKCQAEYPIVDGIPVFAPLLFDEFYERRAWVTELELSQKAPLREKIKWKFYLAFNLSMRRRKFMNKMLDKQQGLLLDLGCGAGKLSYRKVGPVVGIDICLNGLRQAKKVYNSVAQADALALPFADDLFDFVVSTDLIEHIPAPQKDKLMQEMWRVLKPGGKLIHEIETLSYNVFYRLALRDIDLFFRYFVTELSGHFGLETVEETLQRFQKLGAKKLRTETIYDLFWPLQDFSRSFGQGYRKRFTGLAFMTKITDLLAANKSVKLTTETLLGIFAGLFERFRSIKCAKDIGVCFEKPVKQ